MLADPEAVTHTLFGKEILVNGYFTSVLGAPALNMGVFVGIISGFVGGIIYNKYYNYRKLPDALAFFNGKRFVPMVVILLSLIISAVLAGCCMAGDPGRYQCIWCMDRRFFHNITGAGTIYLWYFGTSAPAIRTSSYADYSYELYLLWRYL